MQGNIPFIHVEGDTIPEVFENLMRRVWQDGVRVQTEYDKPEEPESRDASAVAVECKPKFSSSWTYGNKSQETGKT